MTTFMCKFQLLIDSSLPQELISFLKEHNAYERFCENLKGELHRGKNLNDYVQDCINTRNLGKFIDYAFSWFSSKEGLNYWENLCSLATNCNTGVYTFIKAKDLENQLISEL